MSRHISGGRQSAIVNISVWRPSSGVAGQQCIGSMVLLQDSGQSVNPA